MGQLHHVLSKHILNKQEVHACLADTVSWCKKKKKKNVIYLFHIIHHSFLIMGKSGDEDTLAELFILQMSWESK